MTCPEPERLAAAVAGEDEDALAHAATCAACDALVVAQRAVVSSLRGMAVTRLTSARRDELAAEVMAHADRPSAPRRVWWAAAGAALAAAAAVMLVVITRAPVPESAAELGGPLVEHASEPHVAMTEQAPPAPPAPLPASPRLMTLTDGELSVDTAGGGPITVITGETRVVVHARAKLVARRGVIVQAHVFAGTAEIERAGRTHVVKTGDVWTAPHSTDSLGAFRAAWEALHAARYAEAVAAFDRATDEVVAEDAAFWSAIASERDGNRTEAARRLRSFLARYPSSPRADAARSALERVTR